MGNQRDQFMGHGGTVSSKCVIQDAIMVEITLENIKKHLNCDLLHSAVQLVAWVLLVTGARITTSVELTQLIYTHTFFLFLLHFIFSYIFTDINHKSWSLLSVALSFAAALLYSLNFDGGNDLHIAEIVFQWISFGLYLLALFRSVMV